MIAVGRTLLFRWVRIVLAAVALAVLASIVDAIMGYRTGSKAIAWALLAVTLLSLGSGFIGVRRRTETLTG